jgi:hypothetical protein
MSVVKGTWENGRIVFDGPVNWSEGSRLVIREEAPVEIAFLTEEEQGDDPESVRRWIDELRAVPALPMAPEQEAELLAWRRRLESWAS